MIAAQERSEQLLADRVDERVGVAVHEPPLVLVAAEDEGDAQREVLFRQAADLAVLPFHHDEDDELGRRERLDDVELRSPPWK